MGETSGIECKVTRTCFYTGGHRIVNYHLHRQYLGNKMTVRGFCVLVGGCALSCLEKEITLTFCRYVILDVKRGDRLT